MMTSVTFTRTQVPSVLGALFCLGVLALAVGCGGGKLPSRDQIPHINSQVARIEQGIREKNPALIDSLLSVDILDKHLSSDSLLRYIYGPSGDLPFDRLADCRTFYNRDFAVVDCYIQSLHDSTQASCRPLRLVLEPVDDTLWLLTSFEPGEPDQDSIAADSVDSGLME